MLTWGKDLFTLQKVIIVLLNWSYKTTTLTTTLMAQHLENFGLTCFQHNHDMQPK